MKEQPIFGAFLIIIFLIFKQKIPSFLKIVWLCIALPAAYHSFWPYYAPSFAPSISNILGWNSTLALFVTIVYPITLLKLSSDFNRNLIQVMKWYLFFNCLVLIYGGGGFFSANTFSACVSACFIGQWDLRHSHKWVRIAEWIGMSTTLFTLLWIRARTGGMIVSTVGIVVLIQHCYKIFPIQNVRTIVFIFGCLMLGSLIFYWPHLAHEHRIEMWNSFFTWWTPRVDHFFGAGLGSFEWIGPALDPGPTSRGQGYGFFLMHNDWLQLFFETGCFGATAVLAGFGYVATKLKGIDLATWLAIGIGMISYYPSHAWPVQFLALILVAKLKTCENPQISPYWS